MVGCEDVIVLPDGLVVLADLILGSKSLLSFRRICGDVGGNDDGKSDIVTVVVVVVVVLLPMLSFLFPLLAVPVSAVAGNEAESSASKDL